MSSSYFLTIRPGSSHWVRNLLLSLSLLIAIGFILLFAVPYFYGGGSAGEAFVSSGRLTWLLAHIGTAMVALLIGPVQLWMGLAGKALPTHRLLGVIYISAIAVSSITTYYLSITTELGWVFGAGLAGLSTAWVVSTGLAFAAIRFRNFDQHKEWMIRSYVVTFGFVFFRTFVGATEAASVGELSERLTAASWFCWSVPLLITEAILQGRKIFSKPQRQKRGKESNQVTL
jgi:uncharacterized membrane protein